MKIKENDPMEMYVEDEKVILKKYEEGCTFCGDLEDLIEHQGKNICKQCRKKIK